MLRISLLLSRFPLACISAHILFPHANEVDLSNHIIHPPASHSTPAHFLRLFLFSTKRQQQTSPDSSIDKKRKKKEEKVSTSNEDDVECRRCHRSSDSLHSAVKIQFSFKLNSRHHHISTTNLFNFSLRSTATVYIVYVYRVEASRKALNFLSFEAIFQISRFPFFFTPLLLSSSLPISHTRTTLFYAGFCCCRFLSLGSNISSLHH